MEKINANLSLAADNLYKKKLKFLIKNAYMSSFLIRDNSTVLLFLKTQKNITTLNS